jgi:hypothetical protein
MASNTLVLEKCLDQVTQHAPQVLARCIDHVIEALQEAEYKSTNTSERAEFTDAWRELLQHKAAWCREYPAELRSAFRLAVQSHGSPAKSAPRKEVSDIASLTLVDDDEVRQEIEASRLVQQVMPRLESPISELDALVSSAMGLETVHAERNPVRPEIFARTLRELVSKTSVKSATGSLWLKYLADPLGAELQQLYDALVKQLKGANVQAAGYGRLHGAGAAAGPRRASGDDFAQTEAPQDGRQQSHAAGNWSGQAISHALLRDFLRHADDGQSLRAPSQAYYDEVRQELAELSRQGPGAIGSVVAIPDGYRELPVVDRPALAVDVHSTLNSQVWGTYAQSHERSLIRSRLRQDVTQMAQVLGLELVREVVDQVARDPRLLKPLREAIVALEPSLLRLAMVDPRFFSEEDHPGRQLMERVAQRSFKYNDEFSSEFAGFFGEVRDEFTALNDSKIVDAGPFEAAQQRLQALWGRQDSEDEARHRDAMEAVRFAETRHAEAEQIAGELSQRPDVQEAPEVVQDFLFGPWSLVLAHAKLSASGQSLDPGGYTALISDLVWSVKREVTLRLPAQLFERVPPLLAKLREGLALLGQDPAEHEAFFNELMKLHHPVLKLRRAKSRRDARESGLAPMGALEAPVLEAPLPAEKEEIPSGQPWMSPRELDAAGFADTQATELGPLMDESGVASVSIPSVQPADEEPASPASEDVSADAQAPVDAEAILDQLREGNWVDLYSKRRWHRAQLVWAGSRGTLFMFVSHGGRPHSMTRRVCERLILSRHLRPVDAHDVVAHALDALDHKGKTPGR